MKLPKIIAEIGCNHKGDLEIAKELVKIAASFGGVDAVKFQKRTPRELLTASQYDAPHPNPQHAYGETYGSHREFLELSLDQHRELKALCEQLGVVYSTSVWDLTSAKEMASLKPDFIKIPSACNTNTGLLTFLCEEYSGNLHISLGMTTRNEERRLLELLKSKGRAKDCVLYSCTSGYPVPFEDICLLEITRLREEFGHEVESIGFSGHHLGIAVDAAAVALGAEWIERHFTQDRTWKGTDHAASLEPDGLRRLVRDCRAVHRALTRKEVEILPIEQVQREKLKVQNL